MEQRNYKLYLHITPNGKRYYGITKLEPKKRWSNGKGYKSNQYFTRAINKYGWDNIEHIILFDSLTESEAKELEQYYIQWYDTANRDYGYNISLGGEGGNASEETRGKMSESHKGHKGYWTGKNLSEETKKKLSNIQKEKVGKQNQKSKLIICITTKKIFYGAREAQRLSGISQGNITKCCQGKRQSAGKSPTGEKLVWKYINYKHNKRYRIKNELGEPLVM